MSVWIPFQMGSWAGNVWRGSCFDRNTCGSVRRWTAVRHSQHDIHFHMRLTAPFMHECLIPCLFNTNLCHGAMVLHPRPWQEVDTIPINPHTRTAHITTTASTNASTVNSRYGPVSGILKTIATAKHFDACVALLCRANTRARVQRHCNTQEHTHTHTHTRSHALTRSLYINARYEGTRWTASHLVFRLIQTSQRPTCASTTSPRSKTSCAPACGPSCVHVRRSLKLLLTRAL